MSNDTFKPNIKSTPKVGLLDRAGWGAKSAFFVTAVAFIVSQVLASALLFAALALVGWHTSHINNWMSSVVGGLLSIILIEGFVLLTIWVFLRHRHIDWRQLGFWRWPMIRDVGLALVGFVVYYAVLLVAVELATTFFHINTNQKQELGFDSVVGNLQKTLTFLSLVILPPIGEEILFRGFLFRGLRGKFPFIWAAVITSICFASLHLLEGNNGLFWIGGIDTFILSLVLCRLREKTGNLWAGIFVHMLKNGVAFVALYISPKFFS